MPVLRMQALWTGVTGLPGYSNHHFEVADAVPSGTVIDAAANAVKALYGNVSTLLPNAVSIAIRPTAEVFDISGTKLAERTVPTPGAAITGGSAAAYAGGVGAVVHWKTGQYFGGRPVAGRTFLVPLAGAFDATGTLSPAALTTITNAAGALRASAGSPPLIIWQVRPGSSAITPVTSVLVPDRSAVLRSRRT